MNRSENTTLARLVCDEATAKRVADSVSERFTCPHAVAAFEGTGGSWNVGDPFRASAGRGGGAAVVESVAGAKRRRLMFETIAARDWVAASLADLKPVTAGRFTVHGAHDRARSRRTGSASRSRRRSPSAPAITARRADACWRWTDCSSARARAAFSTSAPAPACSPSRPRRRCARRCLRATSIRNRSHRARRMRASMASHRSCDVSARKGSDRPAVSRARRRSIWCSPISCWRR